MNMRALKKEWKRYRKESKREGVDFLSFEEFVEKVLSEQEQDSDDTINFSDDLGAENRSNEGSKSDSDEEDWTDETSEDDMIDIPEVQPVKLITQCTCKEVCPCHEIGTDCVCKEDCTCTKETISENMKERKGHQLTFAEAENYESYLESLPRDKKYSETEPDLWDTIINTDTFKNAECYDIQTAEKEAAAVLNQYKTLFSKKKKKSTSKKKSTKKKSTKSTKKVEETKVETNVTESTPKSKKKKTATKTSSKKKTSSKTTKSTSTKTAVKETVKTPKTTKTTKAAPKKVTKAATKPKAKKSKSKK